MDDMYSMMVNGKPEQVDLSAMMARHRAAHVAARADAVDEVAALLADPAFDPLSTMDAAEAAGISEHVLDAAGYVALAVRATELGALSWAVPVSNCCGAVPRSAIAACEGLGAKRLAPFRSPVFFCRGGCRGSHVPR